MDVFGEESHRRRTISLAVAAIIKHIYKNVKQRQITRIFKSNVAKYIDF